MSHELQVTDVSIHPYNLSVTTRKNEGDTTELMAELTYRTIAMWLHITKYLKQGVHKIEGGSVEERLAEDINKTVDTDAPKSEPFEFKETFGDSRVTVWDTYRGAEHPCFHLNSDDNPQVAIDVWVAQGEGIRKALAKFGADTQQPAAPKQPVTPEQAQFDALPSMQPATPKNQPQATNGAIVATRAPNKSRQYTDGQLVQFSINKIVKGANKGSVTYNLWGDLGKNYALKTVYKTKSGSDENSHDYIACKEVFESLNLSVDAGKIEAHGDWKLVTKVAHGKNGKGEDTEFFNIISLVAV